MSKLSIVFAVLFACAYGVAYAHSGGTNSSGCHHDRKSGGYHCH